MGATPAADKRKLEKESKESNNSAEGSDNNSNKRVKTNQGTAVSTTKKTGHVDDCTDSDCEGCAEGEIELKFDNEPSAFELFQMAREEAAKESINDHLSSKDHVGMAKKLFDMALESFEKLEKARLPLTKETTTSEAVQSRLEDDVKHAACLVAVGIYMPSLALVQEGMTRYETIMKTDEGKESGTAWVGLGISKISTARLMRKEVLDAIESMNKEDDQDEDEYEDALKAAGKITKTEATLAKGALAAFKKGLELLEAKDQLVFAKESIRASQELEEYGVSVELGLNQDFVTTIFTAATEHIEAAKRVDSEIIDANPDILSLYGSCVFNLARLANQADNQTETRKYLEQAMEMLVRAEAMHEDAKTMETLGQAYLMSTTLTEDEDVILEAFEAATAFLSRALELNPQNTGLRKQLEAMQDDDGVDDSEEDFDEEDGDEEDGSEGDEDDEDNAENEGDD